MRDVGLDGRLARHLRARRVLPRDEADAQRAAGRPAGPRPRSSGRSGSATTSSTPQQLHDELDICFVHDPQPAALMGLAPREVARAGSGAATSTSRRRTRRRSSACCRTSATTRTRSSTSPTTCPPAWTGRCTSSRPAIDPLAPKNMALSPEDAAYVCQQFGVDVDRPLLLPGLALRPVEGPDRRDRRLPGGQGGDPRACSSRSSARWRPTTPRAGTSSTRRSPTPTATTDIKILNNFNGVGNIEVNAFQAHADVVIQKSTREGFGLTVTEALWKGKAVHRRQRRRHPAADPGRRDRLPRRQPRGTAPQRCARAARDPDARPRGSAARGKEHARAHFLSPRYLRDYLRIFSAMADEA